MIVERASEKKLYSYFKKHFIKELDLDHTYLADSTGIESPYAHGYQLNPLTNAYEDVTYINPTALWSAGSMVSNIYDLKTWAVALGEGSLLKPETQALRTDFSQSMSAKCVYGLGIEKTKSLLGHSGMICGYNVEMYYYPAKKAVVIVMVNLCDYKTSYAQEIAIDLISHFYPEALK
jgi:D-alanyl-D-alanine carboxypeptidase